MELKTITLTYDEEVGILTLNRPERNNAWTGRMHAEYRFALASLADNDAVGTIVVTGGGRSFCVGADRAALNHHVEQGGYDPGTPSAMAMPGYGVRPEFDASFAYQFGVPKPIIAAINGPAAGVGLAIAMFADLRFAVGGVNCSSAHGKLNFPAEYGLSWILPRTIGSTRASDLLLSSRKFSTDEAMSFGMLNGLFTPETLMPEVLSYAKQMVRANAPAALAVTKYQLYLDWHRDVASSVHFSEQRINTMSRTRDYKEGVAAYLEGRAPVWENH